MKVIKRNGEEQDMSYDKIQKRLKNLCGEDLIDLDTDKLAKRVISFTKDRISTYDLDILAAKQASMKLSQDPRYGILAGRIAVSNLHKNTREFMKFSDVTRKLRHANNSKLRKTEPLVNDTYYDIVMKNADRLDGAIVHDRDYAYSHFAIATLEHSYLLKIDGRVVERPQHMHMRVAIGIHGENIEKAIETYNMLSLHKFTHASPTLFNAGTTHPQMSSCFLVGQREVGVANDMETLKECALISKSAGGIGVHLHETPASSVESPGVIPFMQLFNHAGRYVCQGANKRKGAIAPYLEIWHADVEEFIDCKRITGDEEMRTRDLFPGLWIPDLFMKRVKFNAKWSLMCPTQCPGLSDVYGEDFERLYLKYEDEGRAKRTVDAVALFLRINDSRIETGTPYICYKDAVNRKSNQQNLGVIKSSNLCTEIMQYSGPDETAVCNLASIALNACVKQTSVSPRKLYFDHSALRECTHVLTRNLNEIIDCNDYPTLASELSNKRHRPIGIGVQGLADVFMMLRLPYDSREAFKLNRQIFETIYYSALEASCQLAKETGKTYESYEGCPVSKGVLQFDMWAAESETSAKRVKEYMEKESIHDWKSLKERIKTYGVRNSLLVALMPTASTAQILGNTESFEPLSSNMYTRSVLSGTFQVVNRFLFKDLMDRGLWTEKIRNQIMRDRGSIQTCDEIPSDLKMLYRTVWEIPQRNTIDMAVDRGMFIDQSQSLNLYIKDRKMPQKISAMTYYTYEVGLKTGSYYLRTTAAADAIQFTVDKSLTNRKDGDKKEEQQQQNYLEQEQQQQQQQLCSLQNKNDCLVCSA